MNKMLKKPVLLLVFASLCALDVSAQPLFGLGAAYSSSSSVFKGGEQSSGVIPLIRYEGQSLSVRGTTLDWHVAKQPSFNYGVGLNVDGRYLDRNDVAKLDVEDLKPRVNVHAFVGGQLASQINYYLRLNQDVSGVTEGRTAEAMAAYETRYQGIKLTPSLGVVWQDESTNSALFFSENAKTLSSLDTVFKVSGLMLINPRWAIKAEYGYTLLSDTIDDSQQVAENDRHSYHLGFLYLFSR